MYLLIQTSLFFISLFFVFKAAAFATKYAVQLAESFHLSKYAVGFIVVAVLSILPETCIAINAAMTGMPKFGLGMLFGSNVADLTLIFAVIVWLSGRGIKVESKILKNVRLYPLLLLLPVVLGLDGHFSRLEGIALVIVGLVFYCTACRGGGSLVPAHKKSSARLKSLSMLTVSVAVMMIGSYFTVLSATALAHFFEVSPILIGMLVVGLGTTLPELVFSLKAVKKSEDDLAVGDILGTVLADATIVVGILALINPFFFPVKIIYVTGLFMVGASIILLWFLKTGRILTKTEAFCLFFYWVLFVSAEFIINK